MATRTARKSVLKEDSKHVPEELWDLEEEEPLKNLHERMPGSKNNLGRAAML